MKKTLFLLVVLIIYSPWFFVLFQNANILFPSEEETIFSNSHIFIDEINSTRGLVSQQLPNIVSRLLINKLTFLGKEILIRYFESFDFRYLFFEAGGSLLKNPWGSGLIFLTLLPLIIFGFVQICTWKNKSAKTAILSALVISPIPSTIIYNHYETVTRVPVFIVLSTLAAVGLNKLLPKNKIIALILMILLLFEFLRFYHNFKVHYPIKLGQQIYTSYEK